MRPVSLPQVAYGATAVRPNWSDLPQPLRRVIERRLGAPVISAVSAGGGFTRSFAALVETAAGDRAFLKAAPFGDPNADFYAREASVTAALPPEVAAPRPLWTMAEAGSFVLCLEAVEGHVPAMPWDPGELSNALEAWRVAASALRTPPPGIELPALGDIVRHELSWWSQIHAGRVSMPPAPRWAAGRVPELAALEQGLPALVTAPGMLHGDLRIDNIIIDGYGRARLCDWTWPCAGPAWFDTVTLLVTAYASGLDTDRLLESWDAPDAGGDGALAAMSGYWLSRAAGGPSSASPHSRQHQLFSGVQALSWLASRRGWSIDLGGDQRA